MNINFPPVDEAFIKSKVDSGYYSNATEVIRDAVRRLREEDERRQRLLTALRLGEEQIARGETVIYTPELLDRLAEEAIQNALNKKPIKDAVKP
jgi:antitoxin ParD1/3/4